MTRQVEQRAWRNHKNIKDIFLTRISQFRLRSSSFAATSLHGIHFKSPSGKEKSLSWGTLIYWFRLIYTIGSCLTLMNLVGTLYRIFFDIRCPNLYTCIVFISRRLLHLFSITQGHRHYFCSFKSSPFVLECPHSRPMIAGKRSIP